MACVAGTICSCFIYQLMVGNHLPQPWEIKSKEEKDEEQNAKASFHKFSSDDEPVKSKEGHLNTAYTITE